MRRWRQRHNGMRSPTLGRPTPGTVILPDCTSGPASRRKRRSFSSCGFSRAIKRGRGLAAAPFSLGRVIYQLNVPFKVTVPLANAAGASGVLVNVTRRLAVSIVTPF